MVVGLTGGLATGKSTVANFLQELGAKIIDADVIAYQLLLPGTDAYNDVVQVFGKGILCDDGSIDRPRLANLIFKDKVLRDRLNMITHPRIRWKIENEIKRLQVLNSQTLIIIDAPLLIEAGMLDLVERLIVVNLDFEEQIKRVIQRDNLNEEEAIERISTQMPLVDKLRLADYIVDNNGSMDGTKAQVKEIYKRLMEEIDAGD